MTTYRMVMIGGKARMSRPSSVLYPLPAARLNTSKLTKAVHARDIEATVYARPASREWAPGLFLNRQ